MRHAQKGLCLTSAADPELHRTGSKAGNPAPLRSRVEGLLVAIFALALPAAATAQDSVTHDDLRSEWRAVQSNKDRAGQRKWWSTMTSERLQAYLQADVDVNQVNHRRWTPLHSAVRYNDHIDVVSQLLAAGADVNAKDRAGDTPLHWAAAENANVAVIEALLAAGANVNATDRYGWSPIHTAAESNSNPAALKALIDAGAKRKRRAYFLLFSPKFLLQHNANMSDADKKLALEWLQAR